MSEIQAQQKYVAFLRGINVGGHHKVPMPELTSELEKLGFSEIKTLLNSGNVIFQAQPAEEELMEDQMAKHLEKKFGFPIPVLIRKMEAIQEVVAKNYFKGIEVHKDLRLYVTLIRSSPQEQPNLPWHSPDGAFRILAMQDKMVFSVLDVAVSKTPDAMKVLEKKFGKDITTRNWNTLVKLAN